MTADDAAGPPSGRPGEPAVLLIAQPGRPDGRVLPCRRGLVVLGRQCEADDGARIELDDARVSRRHAEVRYARGRWTVRDLGSRNGTFVDGARIADEREADDGAIVRIGHSLFWLAAAREAGTDGGVTVADGVVAGSRLRAAEREVVAAAASPTLLVLGESGSGKERLARRFHDAGPRAGGPFLAVNCATIPEGVAERVLFGSRKGAFSGAEDAAGYLQAADGGTLFLDELGELPPALQAKLLRVLETREVWAVGATRPVRVELGVVAATHQDLRAAVARGRFREDLYFRLARPAITVPPLRARRDEIPALITLAIAGVDAALPAHARLVERACLLPWPGNVRELLREMAAAAMTARAAGAAEVRIEHLAPDAGEPFLEPTAPPSTPTPTRSRVTAAIGRDAITSALAAAGGNLSLAARQLGLHRTQLYRLMDRHGIARAGGSEPGEEPA
jgi:transcriptional regulator of acetoin/glycerol metabolism